MKTIQLLLVALLLSNVSWGQKYFTRNGEVSFFSSTPLEDIEAFNNQATCILDIETGEIVSKVLISAFTFEKALMQEHFNENYMESDSYPQATLKAKITNMDELNLKSNETQEVHLKGELTIRDTSREVVFTGKITPDGEQMKSTAKFIVLPSDYNIKIPKAVEKNIAREIEVTVNFQLAEFKR